VEAIQAVSKKKIFCNTVREKIFNTATKKQFKIKQGKFNRRFHFELEIIILIALEHSGKEISEKLFISTTPSKRNRKKTS
jgi:hypothetical protein